MSPVEHKQLPLPSIHHNKNGTITLAVYRENEKRQIVQTKRILRVGRDPEQVKKAIEARQKWSKFGAAKHHGPGADPETTRVDTELPLRLALNPYDLDAEVAAAESEAARKLKDTSIKCRYCGGPHWTKECPSKDIIQSIQEATGQVADNAAAGAAIDGHLAGNKEKAGRYVPPSSREGREGSSRRSDDSYAVRIANLPLDTTEADLMALARSFGPVVRSYLAKYEDDTCKGFAFVNYATLDAAEKAIARLNGYGYANLILTCEHSKPRDKKM